VKRSADATRAIALAFLLAGAGQNAFPWPGGEAASPVRVITQANPGPAAGSLRGQIERADALRKAGEFDKAADVLKTALATAPAAAPAAEAAEAALALGTVYWDLGRLPEAGAAWEKASKTAAGAGLAAPEAEAGSALALLKLYNEAKASREANDCRKSNEGFRRAVEIARGLKSPDLELKCLRQLSICLLDSDLPEARRLNEAGLALARSLKLAKDESICLNNLAVYYLRTENYARALANLDPAYEIARRIGYAQGQNECLANYGIIFNGIGDYDKALEYLQKALALAQASSGSAYAAIDLNNIGGNYRKRGLLTGDRRAFEEAMGYYEKAYALVGDDKSLPLRIRVLNNLGTVDVDLERYPEALAKFDLGLKLASQAGDAETQGFILNNIGIVHYDLGDYETALGYFQKAIDLGAKVDSSRILWEAFLDLANADRKLGRIEDALASYRKSIAVVENVRSALGLEELKASFLGTANRLEAYYGLIDLLAGLDRTDPGKGRDAEAFACLEQAKARAFLDSLEVAQVSLSRSVDSRLAADETRANAEIAALHKKLLAPDLELPRRKELTDGLDKAEAEYDRIKRAVRAADPVYADLKYPELITADEARQTLLDGGTAALAYAVGRDRSFGFALTRNGLRIFPLASRKDLLPRITAYLGALSDKDARDFDGGRELYAMLVAPAALGPEIRKLVVVPDDALAYLPFDALRSGDGTWLVERYAVSYAPSLSSLREIRKRIALRGAPPAKDLLAFGDPYYGKAESAAGGRPSPDYFSPAAVLPRLAFSGIEARTAAAAFPAKSVDVFLRDKASEPALKGLDLESYRIIHFAAHGLINNLNPMRSAVILAQNADPSEDGFLEMREIYGLRMKADLVVLSACESARGPLVRGEGIEGLSRAFFYAGASAVMMSLWDVEDKAEARFMETFYARLSKGEAIVDAQRAAKLGLIAGREASHPYYWANIIVSGEAERRCRQP